LALSPLIAFLSQSARRPTSGAEVCPAQRTAIHHGTRLGTRAGGRRRAGPVRVCACGLYRRCRPRHPWAPLPAPAGLLYPPTALRGVRTRCSIESRLCRPDLLVEGVGLGMPCQFPHPDVRTKLSVGLARDLVNVAERRRDLPPARNLLADYLHAGLVCGKGKRSAPRSSRVAEAGRRPVRAVAPSDLPTPVAGQTPMALR